MPGMDKELHSLNLSTKKDFMLDFVEKFWHRDEIVNMTEAEFTEVFTAWAKKKGYRPGKGKAAKIYAIAKSCSLITQQIQRLKPFSNVSSTS